MLPTQIHPACIVPHPPSPLGITSLEFPTDVRVDVRGQGQGGASPQVRRPQARYGETLAPRLRLFEHQSTGGMAGVVGSLIARLAVEFPFPLHGA